MQKINLIIQKIYIMKNLFKITLIAAFAIILQSCGEHNHDEIPEPVKVEYKDTELGKKVVKNYAKMVYTNYNESLEAAKKMQVAINAFVDAPSKETLQKAKRAWLDAREPYGESEVYRGSNGPIDAELEGVSWAINNEGQMNAWPLNEAYIDYVKVQNDHTGAIDEEKPETKEFYSKSIIAKDEEITIDLLSSMNEGGGSDEKAVSTGWHAIEFLLWGQDENTPKEFTNQDLSLNESAGMRPVTDYTTGNEKDADKTKAVERRKTYLKLVTQLLVDDLTNLVNLWKEGGEYYNVFVNLPQEEAIRNIIEGPQFLALAELSNERMLVPAYGTDGFDNSGQEDEHSCFSDNTHRDVYLNAKGIKNVLEGKYGSVSGKSFMDLLKAKDVEQAEKLQAKLNEMWVAIEAIDAKAKSGIPFDKMIVDEGGKGKPEGVVIKAADLLEALGNIIKESAAKLGVSTANREDYEPTEIDR